MFFPSFRPKELTTNRNGSWHAGQEELRNFISETVIMQADGKQSPGKATTFTCNLILDESYGFPERIIDHLYVQQGDNSFCTRCSAKEMKV